MGEQAGLLKLASLVDGLNAARNEIDVMCEVALFKPEGRAVSIRPNAAGTKVIYTYDDGSQFTYWADEWTHDTMRAQTAADLRALASRLSPTGGV